MVVGKHTAKLVDYGTKQVGDKPVVELHFSVEGQGTSKYTGYFTEKTIENTLKVLDVLGLKSANLELLADGPMSGLLNMNKSYTIVVNEQKNQDGSLKKSKDGKITYTQVSAVYSEDKPKFDRAKGVATKGQLSALNGKALAMIQKRQSTTTEDVGF